MSPTAQPNRDASCAANNDQTPKKVERVSNPNRSLALNPWFTASLVLNFVVLAYWLRVQQEQFVQAESFHTNYVAGVTNIYGLEANFTTRSFQRIPGSFLGSFDSKRFPP